MKYIIITVLISIIRVSSLYACDGFTLPLYAEEYLSKNGINYKAPTGKLAYGYKMDCSIEADFNNDGILDCAALMINKDSKMDLIAIYSTPEGYTHQILFRGKHKRTNVYWKYIQVAKPMKYEGFEAVVTLTSPGIILTLIEKSAKLYYFKDGRFIELHLGC